MRKILIVSLMIVMLPIIMAATYELKEDKSGTDGTYSVDATNEYMMAYINATDTYDLGRVEVKIRTDQANAGKYMSVILKNISTGGKPNGSTYAHATAQTLDSVQVGGTMWINFTFPTPYNVQGGYMYAILINLSQMDNGNLYWDRDDGVAPVIYGGRSDDHGATWTVTSTRQFVYKSYSVTSDTTKPTITVVAPANDTHTNTHNITINGTATDETALDSVFCNDTSFTWNGSASSWRLKNNTALSEKQYYLNISVNDSSNNINSTIMYFTVDYTFPVINYITPATNNSILSKTPFLNISCTDTNLEDFEGNIYNSSSYNVDNWSYKAVTVTTKYFNKTLSQLNNGSYLIKLNCSDSHTLNDISGLEATKLINGYEFSFNGVTLSEVVDNSKLVSFYTSKLSDRYTLTYSFQTATIFDKTITCSEPFKVPSQSSYRGHLICGGMWIDNEIMGTEIAMRKQDDHTYVITVYAESDTLTSRSVGVLNTIEEHFGFYVDAEAPTVALTYPTDDTTQTTNNISLKYIPRDVSPVINCSLYINSTLNLTNETITKGTTNLFNLTGFVDGSYNWSVSCYDNFSQLGNSTTNVFRVSLPTSDSSTTAGATLILADVLTLGMFSIFFMVLGVYLFFKRGDDDY